MLEHTSGVSSAHQSKEKSSCQYMSANNFRSGALTFVVPQSLSLYLWGHLETTVNSAPIENEESFHQSIVDACQTICNRPGTVERVLQSTIRRVQVCIDLGGGYFELLYVQVTVHRDKFRIKQPTRCIKYPKFILS